MPYPDDLTELASANNAALFTIEVSGECCKPNEIGKMKLQGTLPERYALNVVQFFRSLRAGNAPIVAFKDSFPCEDAPKLSMTRKDAEALDKLFAGKES
jgi:hypothetical protein